MFHILGHFIGSFQETILYTKLHLSVFVNQQFLIFWSTNTRGCSLVNICWLTNTSRCSLVKICWLTSIQSGVVWLKYVP